MSTVRQAYRFELDPSNTQASALASHCGAARFAYNHMLAVVKADLDLRASDPDHEGVRWSAYSLRKAWNSDKSDAAPWWAENSKEAYASGCENLARALDTWSQSRRGVRRGRRVGFPRFKRRGVSPDSVTFTTGAIRVEASRRQVTLPRLGTIRTKENTRKLERRLTAGTARITRATVSRHANRWFVSFAVEVDRSTDVSKWAANQSPAPVGVDLGITTFAVCSDGQTFTSPRALEVAQRRLRKLNKELHRRQIGSSNRARTKDKLARTHARITNTRKDFLHKTTTRLARTKQVVVVEDLNVAGMTRNSRLARHIADQGWGEFRRQLDYKCAWYGATLVVAPRFMPSSRACSACGSVDEGLTLAVRTYRCDCGLILDRDLNAARNLAAWGVTQAIAPSAGEMPNACGEASAGRDFGPGGTDIDEAGTNQPTVLATA